MMYVILFCVGLLAGIAWGWFYHRYLIEDASLIRNEARMLCDRLDFLITHVKQKINGGV